MTCLHNAQANSSRGNRINIGRRCLCVANMVRNTTTRTALVTPVSTGTNFDGHLPTTFGWCLCSRSPLSRSNHPQGGAGVVTADNSLRTLITWSQLFSHFPLDASMSCLYCAQPGMGPCPSHYMFHFWAAMCMCHTIHYTMSRWKLWSSTFGPWLRDSQV